MISDNNVIKSLLVCNSNMFIPTVLTEVLSHPDDKYLVISDVNSIAQFFSFMTLPNITFVKYGELNGRFDFIAKKKKLLAKLQQYEIKELVFFHAEYGEMVNWLIKKLSHQVPIKYCRIFDTISAPKSKEIINSLKLKLQQYIYWGINMDILFLDRSFPSLPSSFYKEVNAQIVSMPVDRLLVAKTVAERMKNMDINGKYVLLTGTVVPMGYYKEKEYTVFINKLIQFLGTEQVVSKCHPRFSNLYGIEKEIKQIPSFIPGNVLIDNFDYYIGYDSTLLVEAARAGKISISLVDWIKPSEKVRCGFHMYMESRLENQGEIFYPSSYDELSYVIEHTKPKGEYFFI